MSVIPTSQVDNEYNPLNRLPSVHLSGSVEPPQASTDVDVSQSKAASELDQETPLAKLRLEEFERTQLLILKVESRNVLFLTEPTKFLAMGSRAVQKWISDHLSMIGHIRKRKQATAGDTVQDPLAQPGSHSTASTSQMKYLDEDAIVLWHKHDNFIVYTWLLFSPWISWFRNFFFITIDLTWHAKRIDWFGWVGWVYLVVLTPVLLAFQILYNFFAWLKPMMVARIIKGTDELFYNDAEFEGQDVDKKQAHTELIEAPCGERVYSQALAEFLLRTSAAMYARDTLVFAAAQQLYRDAIAVDKKPIPSQPVLDKPEYASVKARIRLLLQKSEQKLNNYAKALDLEYQTVSELNSGFGGPFASMYWSRNSNDGDEFIIVAVKGTQPLDIREWLIDAGCQKVPVSKRFYSFVTDSEAFAHEGFYYSLFPDRNRQDWNWLYRGVYANDATNSIINSINAKAAEWKANRVKAGKPAPKVYVWVTGHSLGAAIASLLYARLVVAEGFSPGIEVRDGYTYGTPMNSDASFAKSYREHMSGTNGISRAAQAARNQSRYNWRVINGHDIVTKVPPNPNIIFSAGVGEISTIARGYRGSLLDYCAIGAGIKYKNNGSLPRGLTHVKVVCKGLPADIPPKPARALARWIQAFERSRLNPISSLTDHSCLAYQDNLYRARQAMIDRASQSATNGTTKKGSGEETTKSG